MLGYESGTHYGDGGTLISEEELADGRFHLRIGECALVFLADGLPGDAAGRRVRVRETMVQLYPE